MEPLIHNAEKVPRQPLSLRQYYQRIDSLCLSPCSKNRRDCAILAKYSLTVVGIIWPIFSYFLFSPALFLQKLLTLPKRYVILICRYFNELANIKLLTFSQNFCGGKESGGGIGRSIATRSN
jgi:hypothetical protein